MTNQKIRKTLILEYQEKIFSLGIRLHEFVQRNQNGIHINYKIHHLLHDPFTFVNVYVKISKNRGAMTEGYDDESIMKFFSFEIRMLTDGVRQILKTQKSPSGKYSRVLKRTTSRMLTIEPDSDRILNRMKRNQFCNSKYEPIAKPGWLIYDDYDIVEKYGQIFRGLYNYYLPYKRLTRLNRISYILQYSCA